MSVFGILGAALGGYVGYRITRSKSAKRKEPAKKKTTQKNTYSPVKGESLLYVAATNNDNETVKTLIKKGADVNARDNTGQTPLDWSGSGCSLLLRKHGGKTGEELKAEGK